jgi:hypothetical protein
VGKEHVAVGVVGIREVGLADGAGQKAVAVVGVSVTLGPGIAGRYVGHLQDVARLVIRILFGITDEPVGVVGMVALFLL